MKLRFNLLEKPPINPITTNLISLIGWKTNLVQQLPYIPDKYCNTNVGITETKVGPKCLPK